MKKGANFFMVIAIILGTFVAASFLAEIFSTKLNKYYRVDGEQSIVFQGYKKYGFQASNIVLKSFLCI